MTRIFRLRSNDRTGVVINFGRDKDLRMQPFGPPKDCVTPIKFKIAPGVGSSKMTDVLYCGNCPAIFSERCVDALQDMILRDGNLYEASVVGTKARYFVFAPGRVIDCIDESESKISKTAYVTYVDEAAYMACSLEDVDIFLAKDFEWSGLFVSDRFVKGFEKHKLTGASFFSS